MRALVVASLLLVGCSSVSLKSDDATIAGTVGKPEGNGPFPALVLLHGCCGPQPGNAVWAAQLNKWGYVTMEVDSFFGRGVKEICTNLNKVTVSERVVDAYTALDYLRTVAIVDKDRNPVWRPDKLEDVTPEIVERHFRSVGTLELTFPG